MTNPLAPYQQLFPDYSNQLTAQAPSLADAWQYNAQQYKQWADAQRQDGIARGLIDPNTGWPTSAALVDAAKQYGNALIGGTSTPGVANLVPKGAAMTKILDEAGLPKVVYHGTTADFDKFNSSYRGYNTGASGADQAFFFAGHPNDTALYIEMGQQRAEDAGDPTPPGRVISAHLVAKNPMVLSPFEDGNVSPELYSSLIDDDSEALGYAKSNGHDSVVWPHGNSTNANYTAAVFDPEQIIQLGSK